MTCHEALILISGQIDGENTLEENRQLQAHLETCSQCRSVLKAFVDQDRGVAALVQEPPKDLCAKVMDAIAAEKQEKNRKHRLWPVLAAAAAVALVIGLGAGSLPAFEPQHTPMTARMIQEPETEVVVNELTEILNPQLLAEERQAQIVVTYDLLPEMETCPWENLPDGSLLYCLPAADSAMELSLTYGLELYEAANAEAGVSYVLLLP